MKKLLIIPIIFFAISALCAPPPILRNEYSTNAPGTPVLGQYSLNTLSNEAAIVINTNQFVITNGAAGFQTNSPKSTVHIAPTIQTNHPTGTPSATIGAFLVDRIIAGNGDANGGAFSSTFGIYSGAGGIGTNGMGGTGQNMEFFSGYGGEGNNGGVGGSFGFASGSGGNAAATGGAGGAVNVSSGSGGSAGTGTGGAAGTFAFNPGGGGRSTNGNGGTGSTFGVNTGSLFGRGGAGNLAGGAGGGITQIAGDGGFGTNSGGNGGNMSLSSGTGGGSRTNNGGNGGAVLLTSKAGGASVLGVGGNGGSHFFTAGNGGSGVSNGLGGNIWLTPGTGRSNGIVAIGMSSGGSSIGVVGVGTDKGFSPINAFASMLMNSSVHDVYNLTPAGTFFQITNFSYGVTNHFLISTNEGNMTNLFAGYYRITINASIDNSGIASHIHSHLFTNGVGVSLIGFETDDSVNLISVSGSATGILYLPSNTQVSMRIEDAAGSGFVTNIHTGLTISSP